MGRIVWERVIGYNLIGKIRVKEIMVGWEYMVLMGEMEGYQRRLKGMIICITENIEGKFYIWSRYIYIYM